MKQEVLVIPDSIRGTLQGQPFEAMMQLQGKVFRDVPGRKTMQVELAGNSYFIKQHFGVGWREIFKNMITLKMPILGAMTEVRAIQKLDAIGIPNTPLVAYGVRGCHPAKQQSFVLTQDLGGILTAEDLSSDWQTQPTASKHRLILAIAALAKKLHGAGICHRDFYLCHFVVKEIEYTQGLLTLHLIDLHRMLQGQSPNGYAVMKDIAGLFFSCMQMGWADEDFAVFKQSYLPQSTRFWLQVQARANKLLHKFNSKKFQARLAADRAKLS